MYIYVCTKLFYIHRKFLTNLSYIYIYIYIYLYIFIYIIYIYSYLKIKMHRLKKYNQPYYNKKYKQN